ncbi:hypothetical protein ACFQGT_03525 [Natrialbaceae archaeon GCM10025810]|uniref:hypothetical protein n=1 Tax=Halovalidus salilacus TaxID=3075124 RepID=UPI0036221030
MTYTRRRVLAAGSLAGLVSVAGCLEEFDADAGATSDDPNGNGDGNGNDDADGNESDDSDGDDPTDGTDRGETGEPDDEALPDGIDGYWVYSYDGGGTDETDAAVFSDAAEAERALEDEDLPDDERSDVEAFVDETAFETDRLVWIHTVGSNACYDLELDPLELDDADELRVSAAAVDASSEDEACAEMLTPLNVLVRVRFEDEIPSEGSITVTDGNGDEHGFAYASESESVSEDGSDSE